MKTTTFNQYIGDSVYPLTIPQNRVEAIINRMERFLVKNDLKAAYSVIEQFIGANPSRTTPVKTSPEEFIQQNIRFGRYALIDMLCKQFNFTKAQAYYRVRKAGVN